MEVDRMADINKGTLRRFSDMSDVDIAEGDPDPRGWEVVTRDGRELGEVEDLVVDTRAMKVRGLEVSLDKDAFGIDEDRHVLLPIETAQLDHDDDKVIVSSAREAIAALPAFSGDAEEADYYQGFGDYGRNRPAGERASGSPDEAGRLAWAEDELRILQRPGSAGEVRANQPVETERVREVTRRRDEPGFERRPVSGDDIRGASRGEGSRVTESRDVDAGLRKEPSDVEQPGQPGSRNRREGR